MLEHDHLDHVLIVFARLYEPLPRSAAFPLKVAATVIVRARTAGMRTRWDQIGGRSSGSTRADRPRAPGWRPSVTPGRVQRLPRRGWAAPPHKGGVTLAPGPCVEHANQPVARAIVKGEIQGVDPLRMRSPMRGTGAERPVRAMKSRKLDGAKGSRHPACPDGQPREREEPSSHREAVDVRPLASAGGDTGGWMMGAV